MTSDFNGAIPNTCRPPPLTGDRPMMGGIWLECRVVFRLRARADLVIDTSKPTATTKLKRLLTDVFGPGAQGFRVLITSSFKSLGITRDARLIFKGQVLATALAIPADHIASSA